MQVTVRNMQSSRGNDVPNQFIIFTSDGTYFQSYDSIIAKIDNENNVTLGKDWNYSKTTGKYRNQFLGESLAETRKKIKSGEYKIDETLKSIR